MKFSKFGLIVGTIAALSPIIATASPEHDALNACAQAFATSLAAHGAAAPAYKVAYRSSEYGSMVEFYNREFSFILAAHDAKTGQSVARANCSTDVHGTVVALSAIPTKGSRATLAAVVSGE
jgi:hypothetical protein